ncbi:phospho-sugar mutase [Psychroflexus planctonicus]|uniref:Phosphoglucomutase n=1 Tax=Psychroflexus planctonicus TaxID=1526575 RepID=A0ABQ1SHG0_9FLAO|nr:phospho-sugar mutase [Psychroflexus planctonicus]GGE32551.1 phosphoglucomutase [Psychroflexus planctonicus]
MEDILKKASYWLSHFFDEDTRKETQDLIDHDPKNLEESFYQNLAFGTGGMRGIMGVGTNRINKYTLGKNTQGIANYLKKSFPDLEEIKVAIAYDCRKNSDTLARIVANVFAANGIKVLLFSELRPTPLLSYSVKKFNCQCGIVLTASHNPPEYNGYKVYWEDGGQLVPPQDEEIIAEIESLQFDEVLFKGNEELIELIDKEADKVYIEESIANGTFGVSAENRKKLNICFTSLHGTSITLVPPILEKAGFTQLHIVQEQAEPDGNFPTVKSPNPEEPEALSMAIELAKEKGSDIVIGTDPDGDRLGIAVRNENNEIELLNGNQTMVLMTWYLLEKWKEQNKLTGKEFVASTIVSTPMMRVLTESYSVTYKEGLTGFKWIAKLIKDHPELSFIGGGEESFGYMVGDFVRDKDANTSILLACEMAAELKAKGKTLLDQLKELYVEHGYYQEHLVALVKKGLDGAAEIKQKMIDLRKNPLTEINGEKVILVEDYATSEAKNFQENKSHQIDIPKSNVLIYYTEKGSKVAARPSGTEPKIKFYVSVNSTLDQVENFETKKEEAQQKIQQILKELGV